MIRPALSQISRSSFAMLFAVLIAARLLTPQGFMPAFDNGRVAIVICDDSAAIGSTSHHAHKQGKSTHHQPCPYGAASSLNLLDLPAPAIGLPFIGESPVSEAAERISSTVRRHDRRPPSRGPPSLA